MIDGVDRPARRLFLAGALGLALNGARSVCAQAPSCQSNAEPLGGIFFDKSGLIVQRGCDGGDTAQREGWYWLATSVRARPEINSPWPFTRDLSYEQVMVQLEIGQTGVFRRTPTKWTDPDDFTRDQTIPIVAAMGVRNDGARMQRFYHELRRRNWMAQRPGDEMTSPLFRNFIERARDQEPDRNTDGAILYGAGWNRVKQAEGKLDDVGDDLNLLVIFLMATVRKPNDEAHCAREYFAKRRPENYGMYLGSYRKEFGTDWEGKVDKHEMCHRIDLGRAAGWKPDEDCPPILGALRWYFRAESEGSPGLAELY
ncbi:MAG: hypothetical protein AAB403_14310, partial [Planctomycetota bacterium]